MKHHKLFWSSSYDRGLDILLNMWPQIRAKYPDATLDVAYGWKLFDIAYSNNKERQQWKEKINQLLKQDGITHHSRIGQDRLKEIRQQCGIWAYPTYFTEIFCITAIESQHDGLVPVTMMLGALPETAKNGVLVDGDINDKKVQETYLKELLNLMGDKKEWKRLSNKCQKFARKYYWKDQAEKWTPQFTPTDCSDVKVSIYTPTIRDGFWNVMAGNLATQTHTNFEWIIVDGQEKSRKSIAEKYAKEYGLEIKYIYQGKTKHKHGLSNANNLAIEAATGELFVFLQDFTLITPTAIEELINVSKKHPGDFIAPVDRYFEMKDPNKDNQEDWFDGRTDVIGEMTRQNIRIQNKGIRRAEQITDFEQNFGAVPLKTLKHLNGYWEFFDNGLGWDDTEIVYRAKKLGYEVWIDDTNQCVCLEHEIDESRKENINQQVFKWMVQKMDDDTLPVIRDKKIEKKVKLQ